MRRERREPAPPARLTSAFPDTVRGADIAFVSWERLPQRSPGGFPSLGPDLVVEILSPGDRPGETLAKVADWLSAGTRLVWVIDAERRLARIHRQDGSESILGEDDAWTVKTSFRVITRQSPTGPRLAPLSRTRAR